LGGVRGMSLRALLGFVEDDPAASRLAREGGRAFVSSALRPYLIAGLAEIGAGGQTRPTLVVVGDDRAARELAGDLRAWLYPRRVRYYPSRGVAYESHLAPPAHLVGLRVAALDALLGSDGARSGDAGSVGGGARSGGTGSAGGDRSSSGGTPEPPVVVVSAVALSEKVPDPALRPRSFTLRRGELLDLEECASELAAAG
jgi:transcription-repair coupling factor (superfamily II helicase)